MSTTVAHAEVLDVSAAQKFPQIIKRTQRDSSAWYSAIAESACALLGEVRFPTNQDELWRQTPPTLFPWEKLGDARNATIRLREYGTGAQLTGDAVQLLSPDDPTVRDRVLALLQQDSERFPLDAITALRRMLLGFASVVLVKRGATVVSPVEIMVDAAGADVVAPWIILLVESGATAHFVFPGAASALFDFSTLLGSLGANSTMELTCAPAWSEHAVSYQLCRFYQARDSRLSTFHSVVSGKAVRVDLDAVLSEPGCAALLSQAFLSDGDRHVDYHPSQIHDAPHCGSDLFCKGVAKDSARSVYYGFIRVAEGAQRTDAYQKSRNLLLSSDARADAIPNLEIKANDVKCSHGASVSQFGGEDLFYLMSRGLARADAEKLLVEAFFADLVTRQSHALLRDEIQSQLLSRLQHGSSRSAVG